jgi:hypothetical protein
MHDLRRLPNEAKKRRNLRVRREVDEVGRSASGLYQLDSSGKERFLCRHNDVTKHPTMS